MPPAARSSASGWLLSLLHLLRLLRVPLLHLLRLLLVSAAPPAAFSPELLSVAPLLMFLVLLLLEFCRSWFCVATSLSCCCWYFWSGFAFPVFGAAGRWTGGRSLGCVAALGRAVAVTRRRAMVLWKALLRIIVGSPRVLSLSGHRRNMPLMRGGLFLSRGARVDPAVAAVEADAVRGLVHPGVVNVVDDVGVHAIQRRVVEKMPVVPASAFITVAEISEAIVDPAIETYRQAPVAFIEEESGVAPTPIARSPQDIRVREPSPMCPAPSNSRYPKPNTLASRYNRRRGR